MKNDDCLIVPSGTPLYSFLDLKAHLHEIKTGPNRRDRIEAETAEFLSRKYGRPAYMIEETTSNNWRVLSLQCSGFGPGNCLFYGLLYPATDKIRTFAEAREWMMSAIERRTVNAGRFYDLTMKVREYDDRGNLVGSNYLAQHARAAIVQK